MGGPCGGTVEGKGPRMGKAIEDAAPLGKAGSSLPVVFLVEEKACLLAVHVVHPVADAVFSQNHLAGGLAKPLSPIEAGVAGHALQLADGGIVTLVDGGNGLAHITEGLDQ